MNEKHTLLNLTTWVTEHVNKPLIEEKENIGCPDSLRLCLLPVHKASQSGNSYTHPVKWKSCIWKLAIKHSEYLVLEANASKILHLSPSEQRNMMEDVVNSRKKFKQLGPNYYWIPLNQTKSTRNVSMQKFSPWSKPTEGDMNVLAWLRRKQTQSRV